MDDHQVGSALRALRLRRGLTQEELAIGAGLSRFVIGRIERGRLGATPLRNLRSMAGTLDARIDVAVRWQAGDLGRLMNARHAAMHEGAAGRFAALPGWTFEPEVSFAIFGERGVIDSLGWHAASATILVVELKTEIVDINDLMATVDRKRRLAVEVGRARGWAARSVSSWVLVADSRTNRRAVARHATTLRAKFPIDGHGIGAWLRDPRTTVSCLSFMTIEHRALGGSVVAGQRRVRPARVTLEPGRPNVT